MRSPWTVKHNKSESILKKKNRRHTETINDFHKQNDENIWSYNTETGEERAIKMSKIDGKLFRDVRRRVHQDRYYAGNDWVVIRDIHTSVRRSIITELPKNFLC